MECCFWPEIITKNQDIMIGKMLQVIPSQVNNILQKNHTYMWYKDGIYLAENFLVGTFQFETIGIKIL